MGLADPRRHLVLPMLMVDDLWQAGRPAGRRRRSHPAVTLWWTCWVAVAFVGYLRDDDALVGPVAPGRPSTSGGS